MIFLHRNLRQHIICSKSYCSTSLNFFASSFNIATTDDDLNTTTTTTTTTNTTTTNTTPTSAIE